MSIGDGEWKLWREGEPFSHRFTATISDDGEAIVGRWEKAPDGRAWETDFHVTYRKVGSACHEMLGQHRPRNGTTTRRGTGGVNPVQTESKENA